MLTATDKQNIKIVTNDVNILLIFLPGMTEETGGHRIIGFICIWLAGACLTPGPSPA
jgi:hypothetical protein